MTLAPAERAACGELALEEGAEFDLAYRFWPGPERDRLLALEALFRSLRDVPLTVSDPAVGVAKISWWQQELASVQENGSQHPVVRAGTMTEALPAASMGNFQSYLMQLLLALEDHSLSSVDMLREVLFQTAGEEAVIMTGCAPGDVAPGLRAAAAAARLLELMRTLARRATEHRWLPLDLMARHRLSRQDDSDAEARQALVVSLAELAQQWRQSEPLMPGSNASLRFLCLRDAVVARRLELVRRRPAQMLAGGLHTRPGDVLRCWWRARALQEAEAR